MAFSVELPIAIVRAKKENSTEEVQLYAAAYLVETFHIDCKGYA